MPTRDAAARIAAALVWSVLVAIVAHHLAPPPSADSSRASEGAFASGLEEREFVPPMMGPGRWTSAGATFRFQHLSRGDAILQVRVRNHQSTVRVIADREPIGVIAVGDRGADFPLTVEDGQVTIDLVVRPFLARGGRRLGTFLDRVSLVPAAPSRPILPPFSLVVSFLLPAAAVSLATWWAGLPLATALLTAGAVSTFQALVVLPHGILRSSYLDTTAGILVLGVTVVALVCRRRPWLFLSLLAALCVQGVAALSPLVIGLDATFHGHNLADVLAGDYLIVSETQHKPPFQFPYGLAFYVPLVPFVRAGLGLVDTVRGAGAVSGILLSAAVYWAVARGCGRPRLAAATTVLLQFTPWTFDVYSNGNYSNIFAQAAMVAFVAWWAAGKPLGWPAGAAAFLTGSLAHFSGLLFLSALAAALVVTHRGELRDERSGLMAIGVGLAAAALYYVQFAPLVLSQWPRLLEGGGGTGTRSALESLAAQLASIARGWGAPITLFALAGRPDGSAPFDRSMRALWLVGGLFLVAAVVTPIEVRYLYALTFPLAVAGARGADRLADGRPVARAAAAALVAAHVALGIANLRDALLFDWRV